MKYIDAEKLKTQIQDLINLEYDNLQGNLHHVLQLIDSLQQDETQVDKMLCSQVWWEEQGWIMIPPDATIEGIDSLLKQVRKKLQQEQSEVELNEETITNEFHIIEDKCFNEGIEGWQREKLIARYFYQLGLNAKNL